MKEIAIIGPTASGKSSLAIELASKFNANILSVDSLSIYQEIDIVSAKPSKEELRKIKHFGIDVCSVDKHFNVEQFLRIYMEAKQTCEKESKNLIIVGGSSFYLKTLITGLSPLPECDKATTEKCEKMLTDIADAYQFLQNIDPAYAKKITQRDRYRILKGLQIYFATGMKPTEYFLQHPPQKIADVKIYEIIIQRDILRKRIATRTEAMLRLGLIDEICYLEKKYTRAPNPMKAIGIKETLAYLDGKIKSIEELVHSINVHTSQLAKRQQTFNKTQFADKLSLPLDNLKKKLEEELA
ncbi:tRNA dimethylallyltransferase [Nitratiruptor sp. YY08-26]|uniref:tRNA (adenosine(37)-N6)-dimethylallyltransferase MiaA n=1 Tax=unclassified Nitratiruptor TaxID=2624044 RepID=UPI0019168521|nr:MULTISPECIES: tRNA (adenosine(37)-N6)-dimethylallyltransferase MiaA [unclassified Nitratiruptor]BCD61498.1 tRNA dimethylallyltransferase [Nitratiruptor sp. YY08-13]BCD65432.1 tRNA dimethylallyltransferase [Nitratiruptor sp. YY08-26]